MLFPFYALCARQTHPSHALRRWLCAIMSIRVVCMEPSSVADTQSGAGGDASTQKRGKSAVAVLTLYRSVEAFRRTSSNLSMRQWLLRARHCCNIADGLVFFPSPTGVPLPIAFPTARSLSKFRYKTSRYNSAAALRQPMQRLLWRWT